MNKNLVFGGILVAALPVTLGATAARAADTTVTTRLKGYQETPATINTTASGEFTAIIHADGTAIDYTLSYRDLSSAVQQSHIHFGRPGLSGGVALFLCTNLTPPTGVPMPQACPDPPTTITGTLTADDVIPLAAQGIDSGATGFAELLTAIQKGAAYVNVHTMNHPGGEIRGRLGGEGDEHQDREHQDHQHEGHDH
jgi:hypothetical protein